jgi:hypothetical protein
MKLSRTVEFFARALILNARAQKQGSFGCRRGVCKRQLPTESAVTIREWALTASNLEMPIGQKSGTAT